MGLSFPKLPNGVLDSWKKKRLIGPLKKTPMGFISNPFTSPDMIGTPVWAERNEKYFDVAYRLPDEVPKVIMVEYKPKGSDADFTHGYSRFYVLGADGKPVPYNESMWKELHKDTSTKAPSEYEVDSEGRVTMLGRSIKATEASIVVEDLAAMNNLWGVYPTANDYDTVRKLHEGQRAIDKLKSEDKYKRIDSQIKAAQESIKAEQERIAKLEKDLNKVYEEAADAMNYFEEQGIAPDMEGDGEPRKESHHSPYGIPDLDFASMYPGISPTVSGPSTFTGITFKGTGTIMELPNSGGQATVVPDKGVSSISAGDFIVDTRTGKQAVYGTDKNWYIVSS